MPSVSAGLLLYRRTASDPEVFLVHPGGPFWARKDEGAWSVPKGLVDPGEDELECARREFTEETGFGTSDLGAALDLGTFRQASGKLLHIWAVEGDRNPDELRSNLFAMQWPPRSGRSAQFPEVDRGGWFGRDAALQKILPGQRAILEKLYDSLMIPHR
jgi:predicted NUDIX family NTP pyrophosphohydrolase